MQKIFVLDTNVLLSDASAMYSFQDNTVIILGTILQELDKLKTAPAETGFKAREAIRELEELRKKGNLVAGISTEEGGLIRVEPDCIRPDNLPIGFDISSADNRIISACITMRSIAETEDKDLILVSEDVAMRVNASACGVMVQPYRNGQSQEVKLVAGIHEKEAESADIDLLYSLGSIPFIDSGLQANDLVTVSCGTQSALTYFRDNALNLISEGDYSPAYGVKPLNAMQKYALWALLAPPQEIPLVILVGQAGTAKTFLSLAAGLQQVRSKMYSKVFLSRPSGGSYEKIGFLPGDLQEKFSPLYAAFYDNLESLLRTPAKSSNGQQKPREKSHLLGYK